MSEQYLYTMHVSLLENEQTKPIGHYMTNASPPHVGDKMNLIALGGQMLHICRVVEIRITPIELTEVPYIGKVSPHTYIHIIVVPETE